MASEYLLTSFMALIILFGFYAASKYNSNESKAVSLIHDSISVQLICDTESCAKILNQFIKTNPKVIGIDCEWVGNNKISLLQIANNKMIIVIRLHLLSSIPIELIHLLGNIHIIKCGVGIKDDVKKLYEHYGISTVGCIELNNLYQHMNADASSSFLGLNKLYKISFDKDMKYKSLAITKSNWERDTLSDEQLHYAADDALAGYRTFHHLMHPNEQSNDGIDYLESLYGIIDHFDPVRTIRSKSNRGKSSYNSQKLIRSNTASNVGKVKLFDNCKILQPDGSLLGLCSKYALRVHLKEGMAIKINENTIKLKQTKAVKIQIFDEYIRTESPNLCFVCGQKQNLRKYAIFPIGYTKYIERQYYDRSCFNHDSVLLCLFCNQRAQKAELEFRQLLCDRYESVTHFQIPTKLWYAIKCAKTLKPRYWRVRIPITKQIKLLKEVLECQDVKYTVIYDKGDRENHLDELIVCGFIRHSSINVAAGYVFKKCIQFYRNKNDVPFSKLIRIEEAGDEDKINECIDYLVKFNKKQQVQLHCEQMVGEFEGKHAEFIQMWRNNFIQTMKPKFLPKHW